VPVAAVPLTAPPPASPQQAVDGLADQVLAHGLLAIQAMQEPIRKAIQEARSAFAELGAKRAAMEAAREQHKSVRASFDNELATREELGSSYLALGAAELEELSAEHRLECALAAIEYLCGYGRPQTRTADP